MYRIEALMDVWEAKESDVGEVQSEDGFTLVAIRKIRSQIEPRQYHFRFIELFSICFLY